MTHTIKCFIAHSSKNKDYAHNLEHSVPNIDCFTISDADLLDKESLSDAIKLLDKPGFILISDNFLKSTACMYDILSLFDNTEKMDKYAFVIVDGIDETGHPYETKLSDINHVIQYMNYWQAKYDTLRNEIAKDGDIGAHEKSSQLIKLQDIAGSTGEFLRILRKDGLVTYADLMKDEQELLMAHLKNKNVPKEDKVSIPTNNSTDNSIQDIVFESKKLFSESKKSNPIIQKIIEKEKQQQDSNPLFNKSDSEEAEKVRSVLSKLESLDMEDVEDNDDQSIGQFPFSKPDDIDISAIENSKLDLLILGDKLIENGDYSQAVRVLETFVKHQADHIEIPNARLNIARLCTKKLNQFEKATEQLEILISKGDFVIESYLLLAQIAELNHNHISAKSLYDKIISIDPKTPKIHYKLGLLSLNSNTPPKDSIEYFKNAIQLNPKNVDAQYQLGKLYASIGKYKKAIIHFSNALNLNPHHPFIAFEKAIAFKNIGDDNMANHYYELACDINPDYREEQYAVLFKDEWVIPEGNLLKKIGVQERNTASSRSKYYDKRQYELPTPKKTLQSRIDKTVLITGATSGIGRATAEKFAEAGYRIIITGRRSERLDELSEIFTKKYNTPVRTLPFDVRNREFVMNLFDELEEEWRKVDILINNAGLALGLGPIHEGNLDEWETMIDTNLKGLLYMIRAVAPSMVRRTSGHIINIASIAGKEIYPNGNVYIATKHAVDALTRAARVDLSPFNIRISQVAPGHVEATEFAKVRFSGNTEKAKIYSDFNPITATDVADAIYYIATRAPHVNIQDLLIMGTQQANATTIHRTGRIFDAEH